MEVRKPFAVIVTTATTDLMGAVVLAAQVRAAGAVVDTPLAHSQTKRQLRRAFASAPRIVVTIDGDRAEVINVRSGKRAQCSATEAATALVTFFGTEQLREHRLVEDRIITFSRAPYAATPRADLPKAA